VRNSFCFFAAVSLLCNALTARADVAQSLAGRQDDLVTGVAVVVGDSVITLGEIKAEIEKNSPALQNQYGDDPPRYQMEVKKLADAIIESLVEDKLILHEFATGQYNTNALDAVIKDYIDEIIRTTYYGDRARLIASLHQQGVTFETWQHIQREIFIINALKHENASDPHKILISPLKVEQYYDSHKDEFKVEDQVKLRMIVLTNSSDGISAKKLGEEILTKLDTGVPFAELASIYSTGSQRVKGGDYGWVNNTYFKTSISTVAFSLKPGQHSGVIEEPDACYLLMVEDVKQAHIKTLMEVRDDITKTLLSKENARLYELWIERLKRKTSVRFY
jgi:peptidyl-prolyl cis-trans isomerase SurA